MRGGVGRIGVALALLAASVLLALLLGETARAEPMTASAPAAERA